MVDVSRIGGAPLTEALPARRLTPSTGAVHETSASPATATLSAVAMIAARGAPLDTALINSVRIAIAEARYPVDPDKIAARMIESFFATGK